MVKLAEEGPGVAKLAEEEPRVAKPTEEGLGVVMGRLGIVNLAIEACKTLSAVG